jgi:hypothetical protein
MMTHDPLQSYQFGTYPVANNPYTALGGLSPYGINPQQLVQQQIAQQIALQQLQQHIQQQQLLASVLQNPILATLLHTHQGQGLQQNPFQQQNPLHQNPLQGLASPYGQQFASPWGPQFGSPYGQQIPTPYTQQFGSPFAQTGYPLAPQALIGGWLGARGPWSY